MESPMRTLKTILLAWALLGPVPASAQNSPPQRPGTVQQSRPQPVIPAPVGHRQPRPQDLPEEAAKPDELTETGAEDKRVDTMIRGVCRGC
jgi:hypothetical protein